MAITTIFDGNVPTVPAKSASVTAPFKGAQQTRLNSDWIGSLLSADLEVRYSLRRMRARCRQLAHNNDYVERFLNLVKQNVVGSKGIGLELQLPEGADELADQVEDAIEKAWCRWGKKKNCTASRTLSFKEVLDLALETLVVDGECFLRKVKGFPNNPFRFALQFMDADLFDENYNVPRRGAQNEIRMSVEVDEWGAAVAYWAFQGHPSEGGARRMRVPADEIIHLFVVRRPNQTRGIPFLRTAMTRLNMLGGYEEAELVAARVAACKMAAIESKDGENFTAGANNADQTDSDSDGATLIDVQPASFFELPQGSTINPIDWQHPNAGFGEFVKTMLRGVAVGVNASYTSLTGDLREVNFSSIRQGVLDERDGWRVLQTFATENICQPVYDDWLPIALTANQIPAVPIPPADDPELYLEAATWRPRGWTWVDPFKDVQAAVASRKAGMGTLAQAAAQQGLDWRDVIDQIADENDYAAKKGVTLDFSLSRNDNGPGTESAPAKGGSSAPDQEEEN
jgi:lambda family phage portal protein